MKAEQPHVLKDPRVHVPFVVLFGHVCNHILGYTLIFTEDI